MTRDQREAELRALLSTDEGRAEILDRYLKLKEEKLIRFNRILEITGQKFGNLIPPLLDAEFGPPDPATL